MTERVGPLLLTSVLLATAVSHLCGDPADAAEVKLIAANPLKSVVQQLAPQFERDTGNRVTAKFVTGPVVKQEVDTGTEFDAVIAPAALVDALAKEGKVVKRQDVAKIGVGLGIRAGVPKPQINSQDDFKKVLLNAKSVAHSAQGESGVWFTSLLARLGIADEMKPKLKPMAGEPLANAVPKGEAELIVSSMPDVRVEGTLEVALPSDLQHYVGFAGAVGTKASNPTQASAFLDFLRSSGAAPTMRAKGIEPAPRP